MALLILILVNISGVLDFLDFRDNCVDFIIIMRHRKQKYHYYNNYHGYNSPRMNSSRTTMKWSDHCVICNIRINCLVAYHQPIDSLAIFLIFGENEFIVLLFLLMYLKHLFIFYVHEYKYFITWNMNTIKILFSVNKFKIMQRFMLCTPVEHLCTQRNVHGKVCLHLRYI